MDYVHYMGCCLLGFARALAVFYPLGPKRRACIPPLAWWHCVILGSIIGFYAMSHSTMPSFSTRITAVGKAYDYVERETHFSYHDDTFYGFRFVPEGGEPINIETKIILPDTALPAIFDGRTLRIVYLNDDTRVRKKEAIDIAILSGKHSGFHDSLDAAPFGPWLWLPVGATFLGFRMLGLYYMKDDAAISAASDDDAPSS